MLHVISEKTCSICKLKKPLTDFNFSNKASDKRCCFCRVCCIDYNRKQKEKRKANGKAKTEYLARRDQLRNEQLQRGYGISSEIYERMLLAQGSVCAICGRPELEKASGGGAKRLAVDHCHNTTVVRGLLCAKCNQGIGNFREDIRLLEKAIAYLRRFGKE